DGIATEMKESHAGKSLYLDREDIRDSGDGSVYPFSTALANELERALSRAGFGFESRSIERADLALAVSFHKSSDSVRVYLKLKNLKKDSAYRALKGNYELARAKLPVDSFIESLDNRIDKLAGKVAGGWRRVTPLKLFVTPMVESRRKYSSPFAEYVTLKLKARLAGDLTLRFVEEKPVMKKVASTRSISPSGGALEAGEAAFAGADALLEGTYLRGGPTVSVAVKVTGIDGTVKVFAEETIPVELIQYSLENDAADTLATLADTENEQAGGMISIATTKGGRHQIFHEGEIVQFNIRTGKPLYLYVYDINPKGEATLLFPKAGEAESPRRPGINHLIPDDNDTWEIRVEPPYGTDAVKVFASGKRLPLPKISEQAASKSFSGGTRSLKRVEVQAELAGQTLINAYDLVDYYKGVASRMNVPLYESTVYVETRGK
ncbi:MAG: DUF4384 domain-containing protein, partial [Desulfuromonadaceae bacterium]|nr:DUF4384 domain-containing protein [Desulfuromonadaceae bacterium]